MLGVGGTVMRIIKENASLLAVSWGHFVNDFFMSVVPVALFAFAIEMDLSAIQMSVIAFVITTSGTFFQPLVGLLIDKVQKSVLLIYALIVITVGMSLSGLITNYYLLVVVVGVAALGSSVYHPLGSTITIHKTSFTKGKSLSIFMTVGSFAHSAAPIVAIPLVTVYGLKALTYLLIPGLLTAFLLYAVGVQHVTWTKEEKTSREKHGQLTRKQQLQTSIPMFIAVVKSLLYRNILVFGVIILGIKGIEPVTAGAALSAFMIARATATFSGGFISDAIGEKKTMILFNSLTLLALSLVVYSNQFYLTIIGLILLGFAINGTSAANITLVHRIMPKNVNYGTGLIMGFAGTLSGVAMLGCGIIVDQFGYMTGLNVLLILTVVVVGVSLFIPTSFEDKECEECAIEDVN